MKTKTIELKREVEANINRCEEVYNCPSYFFDFNSDKYNISYARKIRRIGYIVKKVKKAGYKVSRV